MKITIITASVCAVMSVLTLPSLADWDPDNPDPNTKWDQLPDPNGWDVNVSAVEILADDFPCSETGWITDIHFWGSWKSDDVGTIDKIHLSIHEDIPAGADPDAPWSHPGDTLWSRDIDTATYGSVTIREWGTGPQGWYDPGLTVPEVLPDDHFATWQVNVPLKREDWFVQRGSSTNPTVYWLDVTVHVSSAEGDFGWKTSQEHWNDDAVRGIYFGHGGEPSWADELRDPMTGESLDLAFVITGIPIPEPSTMLVFGFGLTSLLAFRRKLKR